MKYKLSLSNKESISITEEDLEKLTKNISSNFVILGNCVVNPSFIISITPDVNDILWSTSPSITEPKKVLKGHVNSERGVYVIDSYEVENEQSIT